MKNRLQNSGKPTNVGKGSKMGVNSRWSPCGGHHGLRRHFGPFPEIVRLTTILQSIFHVKSLLYVKFYNNVTTTKYPNSIFLFGSCL